MAILDIDAYNCTFIDVDICDRGHITISLYDDNGCLHGVAHLDKEETLDLTERLMDKVRERMEH